MTISESQGPYFCANFINFAFPSSDPTLELISFQWRLMYAIMYR